MAKSFQDWKQALRELLEQGFSGTQSEIADELSKLGHRVNQSSISRQLRRLGAVRFAELDGRILYKRMQELEPSLEARISDHIRSISDNGSLIVIKTSPGSASLVARQVDGLRSERILGTLAGDDTVFVAPRRDQLTTKLKEEITQKLGT